MELRRTPQGHRWAVGSDVEAPADVVWDLLVDTERWPEWGPTVSAVESPDRRIASGTTGKVRLTGLGVWVRFEVGPVDADRMRWDWEVAGIAKTGHRVRERDDGARVEFEIPLAAGGYALVCRRACRNVRLLAEK